MERYGFQKFTGVYKSALGDRVSHARVTYARKQRVRLFEMKLKDKHNSVVIHLSGLPRGAVIVHLEESSRNVSSRILILN